MLAKIRYTWSIFTEKQVHPQIKWKTHRTTHVIDRMDIVPVFWGIIAQYNWILWMFFNRFLFLFLFKHWPIVYLVHCFALLLRSLFCCVFGLFCSFTFSYLVRVSFHHLTNMRTGVSTSTYSYVQAMHVSLPELYYLPVDSIGHNKGTGRDHLKITRLQPQNSSGAYAPWSYPDLIPAGLELSKLNQDTSWYIIGRR